MKRQNQDLQTQPQGALLFFDVDGTLVTDAHVIPESAVQAIRQAQARGHLAFVNTGRPYAHIDRIVLEMGFDGYLCSCGQYLRAGDRVLQNAVPSVAECAMVRENSRRYGVPVTYEGPEWICYDGTAPMCEDGLAEARRLARTGVPFSDRIDGADFRFDKFLAWKAAGADLSRFLDAVKGTFHPIDRGAFYECVLSGCTKGTAIRRLLQYLHREDAPTYAFGDGPNDIEMLRGARVGVLMGNAGKALYPYADFVTKAVDADGIAFALRHFGLIE